ncbi:MAG TPA: hypothetical protein PKI61_01230 [bacterium]|nr:hypothetical protein [bacterium]HPT29705.1 hypothetical protein [bacterium]
MKKTRPPKAKRGDLYQLIMKLEMDPCQPENYVRDSEIIIRRLSADERRIFHFLVTQLNVLLEFSIKQNVEAKNLQIVLDFAEASCNLLVQRFKDDGIGPFCLRRGHDLHEIKLGRGSLQTNKEMAILNEKLLLPLKYRASILAVRQAIKKTGSG